MNIQDTKHQDGETEDLRSKKRSKLRLWMGERFYTWKRYGEWKTKGYRFAYQKETTPYPCLRYAHKSILRRNLIQEEEIYQHNKVHNLTLAAACLHGIVVQPQETFSYWKLIGKPSVRNGYRKGMMLEDGHIVYGIGGGLCQLSNLIFWISAHTPLRVIERHRHGYDVFPDAHRQVPFGSGATCFYPYGDLMLYNPTNEAFQLQVWLDDTYLHGEWRTLKPSALRYEVEERYHEMRPQWWGGYSRHNALFQCVYENDTFIEERLLVENHAMMMYDPFLPETGDEKKQ